MQSFNTVDEYIANAPKEIQSKLIQLRKILLECAPGASEKISYGIPYYGYKGRLAYFSYTKGHIGFYVPPPVIEEHMEELKSYKTAKATVRFPNNEELPVSLIKKLVIARVKKNDEGIVKILP